MLEMSFASTITDFIGAYPHLAYGAVFLLALSEAIPIVGAVVPGSAIIMGASALVPFGTLKLWPLLIAAVFGAIVGEGASYCDPPDPCITASVLPCVGRTAPIASGIQSICAFMMPVIAPCRSGLGRDGARLCRATHPCTHWASNQQRALANH